MAILGTLIDKTTLITVAGRIRWYSNSPPHAQSISFAGVACIELKNMPNIWFPISLRTSLMSLSIWAIIWLSSSCAMIFVLNISANSRATFFIVSVL